MIAHERAQEQARQLVADQTLEPHDARWAYMLDRVQASTVLEEKSKTTGRMLRRGVHQPTIGGGAAPIDPSRE